MITFKPGVKLMGIQPELVAIFPILESAYSQSGVEKDCVVTSIRDGKHQKGSLHYSGFAVDLRTRHLTPKQVQLVHEKIKQALTDDFDVVNEYTPPHFHIEYQPRTT